MHEGSFLLFIVLVLQAAGSETAFAFLSRFGVQVGVVFLLIGLMLPFATGNLSFTGLRANLFSPAGLLAVTVGALSAYLAAEGVDLLSFRSDVMVGLIIGSLIGVAWFDGIPAGPLVAGGVATVLLRLFRLYILFDPRYQFLYNTRTVPY